tara:strand:+ start:551 stop:1183 length:633 start_codon:yes stop_codon:yes gene_type:complete
MSQETNIERRTFVCDLSIEKRDDEKESRKVIGYASVFNSLSENLGGFREQINRNAFNEVLEDDVRALFNHNPDLILGRTIANTLNISVDEKGLRYEFDAPDTTVGNDLLVSLKRGDITQSSFGFIVEEDSWDNDKEGKVIRTIEKVSRLLDVSPVTYPAYPEASVGKRNFLNYKLDLEKEENEKQQKDLVWRGLLDLKIKLLKKSKNAKY